LAQYQLPYTLFVTVRSVAERGIAVISCLSVRPSVRLSVTFVDCDHTSWNSLKIISRMISSFDSRQTPTLRVYSKGNTPKF